MFGHAGSQGISWQAETWLKILTRIFNSIIHVALKQHVPTETNARLLLWYYCLCLVILFTWSIIPISGIQALDAFNRP